jgi:uncharacterized membrane protein
MTAINEFSIKNKGRWSKDIFKNTLILFLILTLAGGIYISGIGSKGLWYDEVLSFIQATGNGTMNITEGRIIPAQQVQSLFEMDKNNSLGDVLQGLSKRDNHPPLYFIGLFFFLKLFGVYPGVGQLFSAIIAIVCIAVTYLMVGYLIDQKTAIVTSSLFAFSPFTTYYSQEVRPYILLILISLLSSLFLFKSLNSNNRKWFILWSIVSSLGLLTLAIYSLILISHILILGCHRGFLHFTNQILKLENSWRNGVGFSIIFLPSIIWYIYRSQFQRELQTVSQFSVDTISVKLFLSSLVNNFILGFVINGRVYGILSYTIFVGLMTLFIICLKNIWNSRRELFFPLLTLSMLPITLAFLCDFILTLNTTSKMRIWSIAIPYEIVVFGIGLCHFKIKKLKWLLTVVILSSAISSSLLVSWGDLLPKTNAKDVVQWLATQNIDKKPLILTQQDHISPGAWGSLILNSKVTYAVLPLSVNTFPNLETLKQLVAYTDIIVLYEREVVGLNSELSGLLENQGFRREGQRMAKTHEKGPGTYGRSFSAFHFKKSLLTSRNNATKLENIGNVCTVSGLSNRCRADGIAIGKMTILQRKRASGIHLNVEQPDQQIG